MSDGAIRKCNNFAMEKMRQKDAEDRLQRMNTKQRLGTPTVHKSMKLYISP